jgi:peptidoglycan/LPS O-acetylase OafA/YrhL
MEAAKSKNHLFITIDILRSVAALGVFFYHQHIGDLLAQYTKIKSFTIIDIFGASYAVPLFFLISGYCIHLSNISYLKANQILPLKKYYLKRFLRVYPPYLLATIFAIIVNCLIRVNDYPSFTDALVHLFALQGFFKSSFNSINVVLWTITIELAFYLIYPIFYYLRSKYSLNRALLFTLIVSGISIGFFSIAGQYDNAPQEYFVLNLWFAWCCGAYLADKKMLNNGDLNKPVYKLIYGFIIACFILSLNLNYQAFFIIRYQLSILIWTAPMVFLISKENWFEKHQGIVIRIMVCIGLSSYSLYLLHEPLLYLKNFLAHKYLADNYQFVAMCFGFVLIPVIAWLNYIAVEKPFMKLKKWQRPGKYAVPYKING